MQATAQPTPLVNSMQLLEFKRVERPDLFKISLDLRLEVFVSEQKFEPHTEEDGNEYVSDHFMLVDKGCFNLTLLNLC